MEERWTQFQERLIWGRIGLEMEAPKRVPKHPIVAKVSKSKVPKNPKASKGEVHEFAQIQS